MQFEHFLLLILTILPIIYKYSFWLYIIQLKEYRWDRLKEYLFTKQGKSAVFNFWFFLELPLFLFTLTIFFDKHFEIIIFPVVFYFMIFYNIFVLGKFFRKTLLRPKITFRLLLIILFLLVGFSLDLYFLLNNIIFIYTYIFSILLFAPFIIFFCIFLTLGIVNYKKNKLISNTINKSLEINKPIKIGITGSYGKSTVKEFLSQILAQENEVLKTPENINTELGVSSIILNRLTNKFKYFIAEMGAYKIGEIETLGKIVNHKYGFLTAIGNQHLGLFGGLENTKKAKFEIAKKILENKGVLYVNGDNKNINNYLKENISGVLIGLNFVKYGVNGEKLDAKSKIIGINNGKTIFEFIYKNFKETFETNVLGEHNIVNLTGILAFCLDQNIEIKKLKKYLKNLKLPKNTLEIIKKNNSILINDTYNLSEEGLFAGLSVLNSFKGNKEKILIVDDILELGKQSEKIHKKIGKKIAEEKLVDKILFCGVNYRENFIKGLLDGGFNRENIINDLNEILGENIILFEGRNAKKYFDKLNNN